MARTALIEKEKKRALLTKKHKEKREALRKIIRDRNASMDEKFKAHLSLQKLPRNGSHTRMRNRCQIDGRPRAYMRKFDMSRIWFRKFASLGMLPGVKKASW
jgi:small subunit ribosomal protein S14